MTNTPHGSENGGQDIYFEGRIYQGVKRAAPAGTFKSMVDFHVKMNEWIDEIKGLPNYEVVGANNYRDFDQVVLGKDYELRYKEVKIKEGHWEVDPKILIAVPLENKPVEVAKERCEYELIVEKYFGLSSETPSGYLMRGITFNTLVDLVCATHQHFNPTKTP